MIKPILNIYILFILWSFGNEVITGGHDDIFNEDYASPKSMYNNSHLNIFGAFMVWLLFFLINPIYYMLYFIRWVFTVGRKS
jgi:hypothetical protein